jgi:hypothetical protein
MRNASRRLRRLEERFGPRIETEYSRELRRRIEASSRRVAASRDKPYVPWRTSVPIARVSRLLQRR